MSNIYPTIKIWDKDITIKSSQLKGEGGNKISWDFSPSFTIFCEGFPYRHFIIFLKIEITNIYRDFLFLDFVITTLKYNHFAVVITCLLLLLSLLKLFPLNVLFRQNNLLVPEFHFSEI